MLFPLQLQFCESRRIKPILSFVEITASCSALHPPWSPTMQAMVPVNHFCQMFELSKLLVSQSFFLQNCTSLDFFLKVSLHAERIKRRSHVSSHSSNTNVLPCQCFLPGQLSFPRFHAGLMAQKENPSKRPGLRTFIVSVLIHTIHTRNELEFVPN